MTVSGDLDTIDLADLLQNIQVHSRTGILALVSDDGSAKVFFRDGNVALMTSDGRVSLAERLVATGMLGRRKFEAAAKKKGRRSTVEILIAARVLTEQALKEAAEEFLSEDIANLIAAAHGEFSFEEVALPGRGFDPDEAHLNLALPVAPLILEATRRVDHWAEIKKFLPSESMHFQVRTGARISEEIEDPELADAIVAAMDGSLSVKEVADLFPHRRFHCYKLMADFVRDRVARPTGTEDLIELARAAEENDAVRSRVLVRRALEREPHHLELLAAEARLSEALDDDASAAAAQKLMAHLHIEAGHTDEAMRELERAKELTPTDQSLWERTFALALTQGRREDAIADGMQLVKLYRGPGLHSRAKEVLEKLQRVEPEDDQLHIELARCRVDCGESQEAVKQLARRGKTLIQKQDYAAARVMYEEALDIEPGNREASVSIEMIDKEIFIRRRERKRRLVRLFLTACGVAAMGAFAGIELAARFACVETWSIISREKMIEQRQYNDAIVLWNTMRERHGWSLTAKFEVPHYIADLQARMQEMSMLEVNPGK